MKKRKIIYVAHTVFLSDSTRVLATPQKNRCCQEWNLQAQHPAQTSLEQHALPRGRGQAAQDGGLPTVQEPKTSPPVIWNLSKQWLPHVWGSNGPAFRLMQCSLTDEGHLSIVRGWDGGSRDHTYHSAWIALVSLNHKWGTSRSLGTSLHRIHKLEETIIRWLLLWCLKRVRTHVSFGQYSGLDIHKTCPDTAQLTC